MPSVSLPARVVGRFLTWDLGGGGGVVTAVGWTACGFAAALLLWLVGW